MIWGLIASIIAILLGMQTYRIWRADPLDLVAFAILGWRALLTIAAAALALHEFGVW
jgi:hypothetical protein